MMASRLMTHDKQSLTALHLSSADTVVGWLLLLCHVQMFYVPTQSINCI
jgi:hypothetical protein